MNERIQELYREAEKSVAFLSNSKESKQLIIRSKFAELIVRECAAVANINSHQWQVPGDFVLKHFEVE
jgi:hypothetical protein